MVVDIAKLGPNSNSSSQTVCNFSHVWVVVLVLFFYVRFAGGAWWWLVVVGFQQNITAMFVQLTTLAKLPGTEIGTLNSKMCRGVSLGCENLYGEISLQYKSKNKLF